MTSNIIQHYFPDLTHKQKELFNLLQPLYEDWNSRINVISRKDMEHFYEHHVLHSLGIAKVINFQPGTKILDVGTGGGFPGIPLAILFPGVKFHLVDSIGKKIKVVREVVSELGLQNVQASHMRAEQVDDIYDFVVSRAVTRMKPFYQWIKKNIEPGGFNSLPNGILYLKGGDLTEEMKEAKKKYRIFELSKYYKEHYFETKKVVYVPVND